MNIRNFFFAVILVLLSGTVAYAAPSNDNLSSARQVLTTLQPNELYINTYKPIDTTANGTLEPNEPALDGGLGHSVWYRWTAPVTGRLTLNTFYSTSSNQADTVLGIFSSSVANPSMSNLSLLAYNDDDRFRYEDWSYFHSRYSSRIDVDVLQGKTYYIAVDVRSMIAGSDRDYVLNLKVDNVHKADLAVNVYTMSGDPHENGNSKLYYRISNSGPSDVYNVKVKFNLGSAIFRAQPYSLLDPTTCTAESASVVICSIGFMGDGLTKAVAGDFFIYLPYQNISSLNISSTIYGTDFTDTNPANNTSTTTFEVVSSQKIPTLGEYGMIVFAFLMLSFWVGFMRKNQRVRSA